MPTSKDIRRWFSETRYGIAVVCRDLVMIDVDSPELLDFVLENCVHKGSKNSAPICTTPSGAFHVHTRPRAGVELRNWAMVNGRQLDLRVPPSGLAIVPPSPGYQWLDDYGLPPPTELPVFNVGWSRARKVRRKAEQILVDDKSDQQRLITRARAYVGCIDGAIQGQRGSDRTMRVAGVLIQKFGLTVDEALPIFHEWNFKCEPMWSERQLLHKLEDAEKNQARYRATS